MLIFIKKTIYEGFAGLHFRNGKLVNVLGHGTYRFFNTGNDIFTFDLRPKSQIVGGQEVTSKDGGPVKISLIVTHQIDDPELNYRSGDFSLPGTVNYSDYEMKLAQAGRIHQITQVAIRTWMNSRDFTEAYNQRATLTDDILPSIVSSAAPFGIKVLSVELLEFNMVGSIKAAHNDLLKAEIEGQVSLARARNESSTMRSLLNTARLVREHPGLLELRVLAAGQKPRVTFVVGQQASLDPQIPAVDEAG